MGLGPNFLPSKAMKREAPPPPQIGDRNTEAAGMLASERISLWVLSGDGNTPMVVSVLSVFLSIHMKSLYIQFTYMSLPLEVSGQGSDARPVLSPLPSLN